MKLALIAPLSGFDLVLSLRLSYHLLLAQYVLTDSLYSTFYRGLHDQGDFIMLDNGAAEKTVGIDIHMLMQAAELVGADEIVMPDVLDEAAASLSMATRNLHYVPRHKRAMVPQGRSWTEWEYCATHMVNMGCATICIAKRYEALPGGRVKALQIIEEHQWEWSHHIHLLGCYNRPLHEASAAFAEYSSIRGLDTSAPIAYAQAGLSIDSTRRASLVWEAPYNQKLAKRNAISMMIACQGDPNARNPKESDN